MTIKVVTLSDLQCVELRGHDGAIKSLCFDPQNEYLVGVEPSSAGSKSYVLLTDLGPSDLLTMSLMTAGIGVRRRLLATVECCGTKEGSRAGNHA